MQINFNNGNSKKHNQKSMGRASFDSMMKMREKQLPDIQASIQDALKDYNGEAIAVLIQKEDENGLPAHVHIVMAGVTRTECQVAMAKALDRASVDAIGMMVEAANGDANALLDIAKSIIVDKSKED
ncbi:hypothetical protein KC963_02255 [Candidatus Saccharibacteria bacterium]|nr:hypothetical protein [Candidatus Saccharibacteria bacterium]